MDQFDVFISHASEDRQIVEHVLAELRKSFRGLRFWVDFEQVQPGMNWSNEILQAASSSAVLLVFGTAAAFRSRWVQHEIGIGLQRHLFETIPFVILAFDPSVIPADLLVYQYLDFQDPLAGVDNLRDFLRKEFKTSVRPKLAMDSAIIFRHLPSLPSHPPCPEILGELSRGQLRARICKALSRPEVAVLWFDVLDDRMDDDLPSAPKAICVMELLLKSGNAGKTVLLLSSICRDYPQLAADG